MGSGIVWLGSRGPEDKIQTVHSSSGLKRPLSYPELVRNLGTYPKLVPREKSSFIA
jgi:hypothetical protein